MRGMLYCVRLDTFQKMFVLVTIFSAENATFQLHVFFVKIAFRSLMLYSIFQSLAIVYNSIVYYSFTN